MNRFISTLKSFVPVVDTHYRVGMRVVKTAIAVGICLIIALLTDGMESATISAVAAIVTIKVTQDDTLRTGVFRLLGTLIGGVLGILTVIIGLFLPYYNEGLFVVVIPLVLILNLYICNVLSMQDSCSISCVVTIVVAAHIAVDSTVGEALMYTLVRLRDTFVGVTVASVLNVLPFFVSRRTKKGQDEDETGDGDKKKNDDKTGDEVGETEDGSLS